MWQQSSLLTCRKLIKSLKRLGEAGYFSRRDRSGRYRFGLKWQGRPQRERAESVWFLGLSLNFLKIRCSLPRNLKWAGGFRAFPPNRCKALTLRLSDSIATRGCPLNAARLELFFSLAKRASTSPQDTGPFRRKCCWLEGTTFRQMFGPLRDELQSRCRLSG